MNMLLFLPAGRALGQVKPLFIKLEGSIADEEKSKLGDKS